MAELVDAHGSGPCARKGVEVQVLSSASESPGRGRLPPGGARLRRPLAALTPLRAGPRAQHCDPALRDVSATPGNPDEPCSCSMHHSLELWRPHAHPRGIPRSRDVTRLRDDDDHRVDALVLRVALAVLVVAFASWLALVRRDRARTASLRPPRREHGAAERRAAQRLVRRARGTSAKRVGEVASCPGAAAPRAGAPSCGPRPDQAGARRLGSDDRGRGDPHARGHR